MGVVDHLRCTISPHTPTDGKTSKAGPFLYFINGFSMGDVGGRKDSPPDLSKHLALPVLANWQSPFYLSLSPGERRAPIKLPFACEPASHLFCAGEPYVGFGAKGFLARSPIIKV